MYQIAIHIKDANDHEHQYVGTAGFKTYYKHRPNIDLRVVRYSQDFCTLGSTPTVFKSQISADMVAAELREVCANIAESVHLELGINRIFTITVERVDL